MKSTTSFIVINDSDLSKKMPWHFTRDGGYYTTNDNEERDSITWQQLMDNYQQVHGGKQPYSVNGTPIHLIKIELSPIDGDYSESAAFQYGLGMSSPLGQVMNYNEAEAFITQYSNLEIE